MVSNLAISGYTYSSGSIAVGTNPTSLSCTNTQQSNVRFYELLIYPQAVSFATQQSIMRNQIAMRLNSQPKLKKWPLVSYSVRKLNSTYYNGPVMRIRRFDDSVADLYVNELGQEQALYDIASSTNLTTLAAMINWTQWLPVYLVKWYDQAGNAKDFV